MELDYMDIEKLLERITRLEENTDDISNGIKDIKVLVKDLSVHVNDEIEKMEARLSKVEKEIVVYSITTKVLCFIASVSTIATVGIIIDIITKMLGVR